MKIFAIKFKFYLFVFKTLIYKNITILKIIQTNLIIIFFSLQNAIKHLYHDWVDRQMAHSQHQHCKILQIIQDNAFIFS